MSTDCCPDAGNQNLWPTWLPAIWTRFEFALVWPTVFPRASNGTVGIRPTKHPIYSTRKSNAQPPTFAILANRERCSVFSFIFSSVLFCLKFLLVLIVLVLNTRFIYLIQCVINLRFPFHIRIISLYINIWFSFIYHTSETYSIERWKEMKIGWIPKWNLRHDLLSQIPSHWVTFFSFFSFISFFFGF